MNGNHEIDMEGVGRSCMIVCKNQCIFMCYKQLCMLQYVRVDEIHGNVGNTLWP